MAEQSSPDRDDLRLHLLVLRCQMGDEHAFALLFDRFGPRTLAHLRGLIADAAEDVQQDVWLTVYRSIATLSNPGAFRTWLFRTTRNRAVDYLRKRKRDMELIDESTGGTFDTSEVPEEGRFAGANESLLETALTHLPPLQREVLLLRYRDDLSYSQIALVVGCPLGTVRTRLHHAKRRLHQLLERGTP